MTAEQSILAMDALERMRAAVKIGDGVTLSAEEADFVLDFVSRLLEQQEVQAPVTIWEGFEDEDIYT